MFSFEDLMARLNISGSENVKGADVSKMLQLLIDKLSESHRLVRNPRSPTPRACHSRWVVVLFTRGVCS